MDSDHLADQMELTAALQGVKAHQIRQLTARLRERAARLREPEYEEQVPAEERLELTPAQRGFLAAGRREAARDVE